MDYEAFYQELRKPDLIPGYEILQKIGGGVFGEVFKARKKSIGRMYVVKFLKIEDERQRHIIEKELASLRNFAQIDHPNLVGIEDQGVVRNIPYIIMTFAGDETLRDRLSRGPIPEGDRENLFYQILCGVEALHQRSIVHFDLKPANIFIKDDTARVGDYGLSKMLSESRQSLSFGRGTPYYMAPEVLRRKGDLRADVYSLGAILFELVTGKVPFDGDSDWEVLRKHEVEAVAFPRDFPDWHRDLVDTAMRKDADERFSNAGAFRNAFRSVVGTLDLDAPAIDAPPPEPTAAPPAMPAPQPAIASPDPTAEKINRLARDTTTRLREFTQRHATGAVSGVAPAASATAERPATASSSVPPPIPEPASSVTPTATYEQPRRRGVLYLLAVLFAVFAILVGLVFFFVSLTGHTSRNGRQDSFSPPSYRENRAVPVPSPASSDRRDASATHGAKGESLDRARARELVRQFVKVMHRVSNGAVSADEGKALLEEMKTALQEEFPDFDELLKNIEHDTAKK